jgi:hypothetical protein
MALTASALPDPQQEISATVSIVTLVSLNNGGLLQAGKKINR